MPPASSIPPADRKRLKRAGKTGNYRGDVG
jgi:hypothetical protein